MMDINKSIFISHSRDDETEVKHVIAWLEELGIKIWVSFEDIHDLNFLKKISIEITKQDYFLLVLSKNSIASDNVLDEIYKAKDSRKKIFIYALEDVAYPDGIDLILNRLQRIDKFKFPKDHLSRLAKIILNETSARPGEVERHISNSLTNFNAKTEQTRLKYLDNLREWTDAYLDSMWDNGKFKSAPSKICIEELNDLANTLGLKAKDIEEAQNIQRDKKEFAELLDSALKSKTISSRTLETLERKRYELGVSKKEVKESVSRRKFVPPISQEVKSSSYSGNQLDIEWLIESLNQRREFLADTSYENDKPDQNITASHAKDEQATSTSILESHLDPKKQLLDVQKTTCSEANLNPSKIVPKNSDSEKPLSSEHQKGLSIPSKDKQATAASGNSIAITKNPELKKQIDKSKISSKSYQFSSKSIVYKPAQNPKTDFVELTEIRQEGSLVIFIGKKGSQQTAYQEKFENGFVRAIRWERFFKLYFSKNSTSFQIDYISGSKDYAILEQFIANLSIPVLDAPSISDATSQPLQEDLLSKDQQIIEVNGKNPAKQSRTLRAKTLSTPDKQGSKNNPAIAESKEPKAVFEFSEKSTFVFQISKGKKLIVITLQKVKQNQSTFMFFGQSVIGVRQEVLEIESFKEIIMGNNSAKLVQDEQNFLVIGFDRFARDNNKVRSFCESIGAPILEDNEAKFTLNLVEMFGRQANSVRGYAAENTFQSTDEGKQLHSFLASKDADLRSSITWPWIDPSRSEDRSLCDTLLKHQQFQERLITKIHSFDVASRLHQLFRNLKQPLNLLYGQDLCNNSRMRKVLKKHGKLQDQSCKPLVYFSNNGLFSRRSLIVFDQGVSFQAGNNSRHHLKFGVPGQRIAETLNVQVNNNNLKVKALSPALLSAKTFEVTYDFRSDRSSCQAFSDSLLKILSELDDHQINYARLRESLVNELWEVLSSQNFVAPVSFHLYGDSVITPLAKSGLDPILTTLFNGAKIMIPCEQDYLFSLSASYHAPVYNYRSAFLVTLHGIVVASKTILEIDSYFVTWSDLSGFTFAQSGRSFFEIKRRHLKSHLAWPTLPGKEQVFSEIAAFVISLKERLSTLPAR